MPREPVIRALAAQDAARLQAFVRALSPQTRRERYFSAIQELSPAQLQRTLHAVAPDVSLAALAGESIVGVAECSGGEFAVVVADAWQGSGLGRALMERLLAEARGRRLHGIVNKGNRAMLRLARSLGFRAACDPDPELVHMELELAR
jgi:acetyltransferase